MKDDKKPELDFELPPLEEGKPKILRPRKKKPRKRTGLVLDFESEQILELSRLLFKAGLTFHQFFGFLIQQTVIQDERLLLLLEEARGYKKQRILDGKDDKADAETLYSLIQEQLNAGNHN